MSDPRRAGDDRPRRDPLIVETPPTLPPVATDDDHRREHVDPIRFNLAALKAEMIHLVDRAQAWRVAWGDVETPPDGADDAVVGRAWMTWHYYSGLCRAYDADPDRPVFHPGYARPLRIAVDRVLAALHGPVAERANALTSPETTRVVEWACGFLPDLRFSADDLDDDRRQCDDDRTATEVAKIGKRGGGRKRDPKVKEIAEEWATGKYLDMLALAEKLGVSKAAVKKAVDSHRRWKNP